VSLDHLTALSIVRTLSGRPRYPRHAEGEANMANTLMECCLNEAYARAVVAEFQENFPTPAEVRTQAANIAHKFGGGKTTVCDECSGSGWVSRTRIMKGCEYSYADKCVCRQPVNGKSAGPPIEFPRTRTKTGT
jgi:hypothetical protein